MRKPVLVGNIYEKTFLDCWDYFVCNFCYNKNSTAMKWNKTFTFLGGLCNTFTVDYL